MKPFLTTTMAASAVVLSLSANADIISYGGYTHDTTTDIVTGNGLEWLQWDRTLGQSIDSIQSQLGTLEGGGWKVASNVQMAHLFNAFDFGITFDTDENTFQLIDTGYQYPDSLAETDEMFIAMFGATYETTTNCPSGHCYKHSMAFFGLDPDNDNKINKATVYDDYIIQWPSSQEQKAGRATLGGDGDFIYNTYDTVGVALVREVSTVPIPAALWLFGSGLLGLIGVARRK